MVHARKLLMASNSADQQAAAAAAAAATAAAEAAAVSSASVVYVVKGGTPNDGRLATRNAPSQSHHIGRGSRNSPTHPVTHALLACMKHAQSVKRCVDAPWMRHGCAWCMQTRQHAQRSPPVRQCSGTPSPQKAPSVCFRNPAGTHVQVASTLSGAEEQGEGARRGRARDPTVKGGRFDGAGKR